MSIKSGLVVMCEVSETAAIRSVPLKSAPDLLFKPLEWLVPPGARPERAGASVKFSFEIDMR